MNINDLRINLKVFQINRSFYEIKGKSFKEIVEIVRVNHHKILNAKFDNLTNINAKLVYSEDGDYEFASYCYNQPKDQYYWKLFLPEQIIEDQDFEITEFSYVLFIHFENDIFCVIGGAGMTVIKKYLNHSFGIEIYQYIAKPKEDVVIEMNSRGIASNISQKRHTYNLNQTISETLEYSEIPTKIKLIVRDELKKTIFKKYDLDEDRALMEVGSFFTLKTNISFDELLLLINDLHHIKKNNKSVQLTLFKKVEDSKLINELDNTLQEKLIDDIISVSNPGSVTKKQEDIVEIVHPTKLERFYESNKYIVKAKYSRGKHDIEILNREDLHLACVTHINKRLEDITDRFKIKGELYKLNIVGCINEKEITYANFYSHVVAEIGYLKKKDFRIDGLWYFVKDEFLQLMTQDSIDYYQKYKLRVDILKAWSPSDDEDSYNLSHKSENIYVLDKRYKDNIELCDILVEKEGNLYFIHVKNGFTTRLRECYIQVVLSAKRLSVDLKDNNGKGFLNNTLNYYNSFNPDHKIDVNSMLDRIAKKELNIVYVMAYNNDAYAGSSDLEKIGQSQSNIAKYSLVQVVREMQPYFDIKLIDVSVL